MLRAPDAADEPERHGRPCIPAPIPRLRRFQREESANTPVASASACLPLPVKQDCACRNQLLTGFSDQSHFTREFRRITA